uniref:Gustatory receptor n=1 Tax=Timema bartmani TaxID=61472 RepID=A0A7R9F2S0_9NEOP|nr:unnamed protein product [Timema bartmani]
MDLSSKFLGCLPTVKTEGGGLEPSFRLSPVHCRPRHLVVSIYTTMVYCAVLVSIVLMIYQRILIIHYTGHATEANIFDEYVTHYIPLLMVMCEPLVPMLYWFSTPALCAYLAGWTDLERLYQVVTGGRLKPLPRWAGLWAAAAVLVVGGGLTAMSQMTPGIGFWYILTQSFSFTRMLSNAILWVMLCNAATNSSKRFLEAYTHELSLTRWDQWEEGGGRSELWRYEQLWLRLKKQVQSMGKVLAFNYIAHFGTQAGFTLIHELQRLMLAERSRETKTVVSPHWSGYTGRYPQDTVVHSELNSEGEEAI